jgi:hypothetical protein
MILKFLRLGIVAYAYNPNYSRGGGSQFKGSEQEVSESSQQKKNVGCGGTCL